MNAKPTFIPGLSHARLTRYYDPVLKWLFWEEFFRRPLIQAVDAQPGQAILDIGCGTATLTLQLVQAYPRTQVIGLDIDGVMLAMARAKARAASLDLVLLQGGAERLPCAASSFHHSISSFMVHHLTTGQKRQMLAEVRRVTRPGGYFLLLDFAQPHPPALRSMAQAFRHFEQMNDNLSGRLPQMLMEAGFGKVEICWQAFGGLLTLWRALKT